MLPYIWYYTWAVLLVLCNVGALTATLLALPGNWVIVGLTALFAWLVHGPSGAGVSWYTVAALIGLALLGELAEFGAGAAGAARSGGSRRGMVLAMFGAMVGSMAGVAIGVPIPILGSLIGAVIGGALGAFGGAYLGESWKGRPDEQRLAVGTAAFVGRLLGTIGKLWAGAVMVVVAAADAFFFSLVQN
ncbi:MAG: DUF456 family protein [Planctomycetaceae bacterium]|nr:DUF456 family protein [Planctomycetaceae bacterium]